MKELIEEIFKNPLPSLAIIGNLIVIEGLLSVDNAAVLATMVMDLKPADRKKALRYGIWGAYIFRGFALVFASYLIGIWWLKPLGGIYLLYLAADWLIKRIRHKSDDKKVVKKESWFYRVTVGSLGTFWATVVLVELMDIAFSIDNVFAAVAFTPNIILVCTGVFIGILAMRFIAQWFVMLMERFPFLEGSAYLVIGILGLKLVLSLYDHYYPETPFGRFLSGHHSDLVVSLITVAVFLLPVLTSWWFNIPAKKT